MVCFLSALELSSATLALAVGGGQILVDGSSYIHLSAVLATQLPAFMEEMEGFPIQPCVYMANCATPVIHVWCFSCIICRLHICITCVKYI